MIKKLVIGTAASLSALALAAASATAQPMSSPADASAAATPDVVLNEVGIDLNPFTADGTFVEVMNTTSSVVSLDGYQLRGCTASSDFAIVTFGLSDAIDPANSPFYLIVDSSSWSGSENPDLFFNGGAEGVLDQDDGGVYLLDLFANEVVNGVQWGTPPTFSDCADLDTAQNDAKPSAQNSLQFDDTIWCALPPTVRAENGNC